MSVKWPIFAVLALCALGLCSNPASAQEAENVAAKAPGVPPATAVHANTGSSSAASQEEARRRLEGEKRFATNCGRCHQAPHKYPPRVMATAIRHMRVRATITDDDMRYILRYLTQ